MSSLKLQGLNETRNSIQGKRSLEGETMPVTEEPTKTMADWSADVVSTQKLQQYWNPSSSEEEELRQSLYFDKIEEDTISSLTSTTSLGRRKLSSGLASKNLGPTKPIKRLNCASRPTYSMCVAEGEFRNVVQRLTGDPATVQNLTRNPVDEPPASEILVPKPITLRLQKALMPSLACTSTSEAYLANSSSVAGEIIDIDPLDGPPDLSSSAFTKCSSPRHLDFAEDSSWFEEVWSLGNVEVVERIIHHSASAGRPVHKITSFIDIATGRSLQVLSNLDEHLKLFSHSFGFNLYINCIFFFNELVCVSFKLE